MRTVIGLFASKGESARTECWSVGERELSSGGAHRLDDALVGGHSYGGTVTSGGRMSPYWARLLEVTFVLLAKRVR